MRNDEPASGLSNQCPGGRVVCAQSPRGGLYVDCYVDCAGFPRQTITCHSNTAACMAQACTSHCEDYFGR